MKNKIIIFICILLLPISVNAKNKIYSIDMDIHILRDGTANITEVWDVDGNDGTEWYKVINNLGYSEVSNYTMSMDGSPLVYKEWDIDESLFQKRGYYGLIQTKDGVELCFGKGDYNRHKFTLNYTISNFVFNTDDSQVIYFNLIDKLSDVDFDSFNVNLSSYYSFPDTLDVWGYGYKGYAYVSNGTISMSNESDMNDNYVVLLAKFPLNTFDNYVKYSQFNTFNDVYNIAKKGSFKYKYTKIIDLTIEIFSGIIDYFVFFVTKSEFGHILIWLSIIIFIILLGNKDFTYKNYGYEYNKKINKKEVNMFRDIPCNKDIYYANVLIYLNNFDYNQSNILGAIILKWIKEKKIIFKTKEKGLFNKNMNVIDLTLKPTFDNKNEEKLFKMLKKASKNGFLETGELKIWCFKNSNKFLSLFKSIINKEKEKLIEKNHIVKLKNKKEYKFKYMMDDIIYDESVKLYGLKKYLIEFSNMKTKEIMDVHLWDEYLMFACLFGIADKVAKQLKYLYPEVVIEMKKNNFDYNTIKFVSHLSYASISYAKSNKKSSGSSGSSSSGYSGYSSGGGGFSSDGGGGGSFGGGGGGSR